MRKLYIKCLFEDLGLLAGKESKSQTAIADGIGIYQSRLSKIINGKDEPTPSEAKKLTHFFGLPLYILLEPTIDEE